MRPGVHERKWEPDSLLAFFRLSAGYANASRSLRPFDARWRGALEQALRTLRTEQRLDGGSPYRFHRPDGDPTDDVPNLGQGASSRPNGMVHGAFRPSDDASALPLNVPVNLALAAALDAVAPVAAAADAPASSAAAGALASEIRDRRRDATGSVRQGRETIWAYEVDGLGGRILMDDANAPSLLSLPVLRGVHGGRPGLSRHPSVGPLARATRGGSMARPVKAWARRTRAPGTPGPLRSPCAVSPPRPRPSVSTAIRLLGASHAGTFLAHESFDVEDPARFTRPWFAWANTLVGELLERAALDGSLA